MELDDKVIQDSDDRLAGVFRL